MNASSLPSYAGMVVVAVIVANLATAWLVVLSYGMNNGNLADHGPPWLGALSCIALLLCYYGIIFSVELSFWGSVILAALALWGAWVDYTRLSDRRKTLAKPRKMP